jgi:hypothetical protein
MLTSVEQAEKLHRHFFSSGGGRSILGVSAKSIFMAMPMPSRSPALL